MPPKILIADDSAFMRQLIRNILARQGYEDVVEATTGDEAVELFGIEKPDLVILDIIMPGMDGSDALKKLMKLDPKASVIMLTAVGQEGVMKECIQAGAKGYIVKPFKDEEVLGGVEKALKRR